MILLLLAALQGPVPLPNAASWTSYPGGVTTGGAFADLDRDGWLDFVVANGNDILRQRVEVYYNDGAGNYPLNPQWQSADVDYHGHLAVGDVDGDGWDDVAVSVFLGAGGFAARYVASADTALSATVGGGVLGVVYVVRLLTATAMDDGLPDDTPGGTS